MSRYRGPRFKRIRRLGVLPGLTNKIPIFRSNLTNQPSYRKRSRYRIRLEEKQKLRFHYGLAEQQLLRYARIAGKAKGATGGVLLQLLETRLDNILFRLGMASTIPGARQLINHRHIYVNGRVVDIPSFRCKPGNVITAKFPKHIAIDSYQCEMDFKAIGLKINELLVVEYYSRQT
nr:ribosomal protein S4 [Haplothismia exannulata]